MFTDLYIKRPVLAIVISLMILTLGLRSMLSLPILQFPFTQNAIVTVTTTYTGADPSVIAGFISTPLENSIAQASGIDYMTSSSTASTSTITANLLLNYDPLKAVSDITTKVNAVLNQLPAGAQSPVIGVAVGESIDSMYLSFYSDVLPNNKITDYLIRVVQPQLQAINGVQVAEILGSRQFAMRIWLNPIKLAGFGITPRDVALALNNNNFISAAGRTDGNMITVNLVSGTDISQTTEFENLAVKTVNGTIIRIRDVANVTLGANNYDSSVSFNGQSAVYIGIKVGPSANLLTVIGDVKKLYPSIIKQLPEGLNSRIVYDATAYVNSSIDEVIRSLVEAFFIVTAVIFIFLGSFRAVFIPLITIPLSLIGTFFLMLALGYSINLLTLLALVLAIGLVVDDAIIVVENAQRHMEEGKSPMDAAIIGARELATPIIAIALVLMAVYAPIGFMGGLTGALFTEFAFTLAGSVVVSTVIALTLTPMMCSRMLKAGQEKNKFIQFVDKHFERLEKGYHSLLEKILNILPVIIVFAVIIIVSNFFLFIMAKSELAPQEDQGIILGQVTTAANASLMQTQVYTNAVTNIYKQYPETANIFAVVGGNSLNSAFAGMVLKPWDDRVRTSNELQPLVQNQFDEISGAKIPAFQLPSLPGGGSGLPIQFVITSTNDFNQINEVAQQIIARGYASGIFMYLDADLKIDKASSTINFDRNKIAQLGLTMQDVGNSLQAALSEGYINYFNYDGRSYQVIPQMLRKDRVTQRDLMTYYINSASGKSVPLSTVATIQTQAVPQSINHFQQFNSATISGVTFPNKTMGDALTELQNIAAEVLPAGYNVNYASQSRQYVQEGSAFLMTGILAIFAIFLALSALFESFIDPVIVMVGMPMSICGAMIFVGLGVGGASLNIYSEVGLVTLIGLISKHGILIVQFANDLQDAGRTKYEAILEAARIRLRPILMTTAAMVLGVIPLINASGAGAVSRYNIGLVVAMGMSIGTLFTLFVVPGMYLLLASHREQVEPVTTPV